MSADDVPTTLDAITAEVAALAQQEWEVDVEWCGALDGSYGGEVISLGVDAYLAGSEQAQPLDLGNLEVASFVVHAKTYVPRLVAALRYAMQQAETAEEYQDDDMNERVARILAGEEA